MISIVEYLFNKLLKLFTNNQYFPLISFDFIRSFFAP